MPSSRLLEGYRAPPRCRTAGRSPSMAVAKPGRVRAGNRPAPRRPRSWPRRIARHLDATRRQSAGVTRPTSKKWTCVTSCADLLRSLSAATRAVGGRHQLDERLLAARRDQADAAERAHAREARHDAPSSTPACPRPASAKAASSSSPTRPRMRTAAPSRAGATATLPAMPPGTRCRVLAVDLAVPRRQTDPLAIRMSTSMSPMQRKSETGLALLDQRRCLVWWRGRTVHCGQAPALSRPCPPRTDAVPPVSA